MNAFHYLYKKWFGGKRRQLVNEFSMGRRPSAPTAVPAAKQEQTEPFPGHLEQIHKKLEQTFGNPKSKDIHIRQFSTPGRKRYLLVYVEGMMDADIVNRAVLDPLYHGAELELPFLTREETQDYGACVSHILQGSVVIFCEGSAQAVILHVETPPTRSVEAPKTENVVRGPHEGFVENVVINKNLIRMNFPSPNLMVEELYIGVEAPAKCYYLYLRGIANPKLVDEVRTRLQVIQVDGAIDAGEIEQFIEDRPRSLVPTVLSTERPDRATAFLREGHVVVLVNRSPNALILPCTFWSLFHVSEDSYERAFYGSFIRLVRLISILITLFTPAFYVAATNYHPEMVPTDLLLAIAGSRERLPFPSVFEVLLMEFAFELIREAGIRIPSALGSTISIVGALILGQAAVQANVISPVIVIVVALTGLASFAIPNPSLGYIIRIARFGMIVLAASLGLIGITIGFCTMLSYLVSVKSVGVPFLSPYIPHMEHDGDLLIRSLIFKNRVRPGTVRPLQKIRTWWSRAWDEETAGKGGKPREKSGKNSSEKSNENSSAGGSS